MRCRPTDGTFVPNLTSFWTIVPIFLKPDALDGETTTVEGRRAADLALYVAAALDGLAIADEEPAFPESREAAELARRHVLGESEGRDWYALDARDLDRCRDRLAKLRSEWSAVPTVSVADVIERACEAIGFDIAIRREAVLTEDEYYAYYRYTDRPDMHPNMTAYLVGKRVRLLLLCGPQENGALQVLKVFVRRVLRYQTGKVKIENWIHVTNPDAPNYPELLALHAAPKQPWP